MNKIWLSYKDDDANLQSRYALSTLAASTFNLRRKQLRITMAGSQAASSESSTNTSFVRWTPSKIFFRMIDHDWERWFARPFCCSLRYSWSFASYSKSSWYIAYSFHNSLAVFEKQTDREQRTLAIAVGNTFPITTVEPLVCLN